jgi:ribosomal protein S18 acetylase RimI-like enzyme
MRAMSADEGRSRGPRHDGAAGAGHGVPPPGTRVVVRHRMAVPDPSSGATLTDVVGDLVAADEDVLVLATRRGEVRVPVATVEVVHAVPPRPSRRGAPHRALSVEDLERVMVGAWPAMETARLGDWVLRASRGFTNRANSAMTAGSPGRPLPAAVAEVERWYAERGLPSNVCVAGPVGFSVSDDPLAALLLERGHTPRVVTRCLTASTREVTAAVGRAPDGLVVTTAEHLDDAWLAAYRGYRDVDDVAARAVLTGSPAQDLASARTADGLVVGIGRLGVASAWGGVAAMWVAPQERRRGVAGAILGALAARAGARGLRSLHLQTDTDNRPALALYERHGFVAHHDYVNLHRPDPSAGGTRRS